MTSAASLRSCVVMAALGRPLLQIARSWSLAAADELRRRSVDARLHEKTGEILC